jgi:uracil-DNA glycosylase
MSRILIVGEAYGENEAAAHARTGQPSPFVGKSGQLLDGMLKRAGIARETCFVTNVVNRQPPGNKLESGSHAWWTAGKAKAEKYGCVHYAAGYYFNDGIREGLDALVADIERERPECIVALGNLALWATTRNAGIANWRGSELWWQGPLADETETTVNVPLDGSTIAVVPTYHPAYVMRSWPWYATVMHDLRRRVVGKLDRPEAREEPKYNFIHVPTLVQAQAVLGGLLLRGGDIACDVETRRGRIACVGLAWSPLDAICIPLMHVDGTRWWPEDLERNLCNMIAAVMQQQTVSLIGQNFNYDRQYFIADPCFGFTPRTGFDTMIAQHLLYPGTPKDLSHLSSMYCQHHRFWKDEGKEIEDGVDEQRWWWYNCMDAAKTFEVAMAQRATLVKAGFCEASL